MLDFHSEIPAQVALSGLLGPLSREAPLELVAALAAVADAVADAGTSATACDTTDRSPRLPTVIQSYVARLRARGVSAEEVSATMTGLLAEIAPDLEPSEYEKILSALLSESDAGDAVGADGV